MQKIYTWLFFLVSIFIAVACQPIVEYAEEDYVKEEYKFTNTTLSNVTKIATADVDYQAKNQNIFFSFTDGKVYSTTFDAWDIAIVTAVDSEDNPDFFVISNSGDYGSNARVYAIPTTKQLNDLLNFPLNKIQQVSFKENSSELSPYQLDDFGNKMANPLKRALTDGKKYLLKVGKDATTYKVFVFWFTKLSSPQIGTQYQLQIIPCETDGYKIRGINSAKQYAIKGKIDGDYSFNYIKLHENHGKILTSADGVPTKQSWDIMFRRTNLYSKQMGEVFATDGIIDTSSILINNVAGVEAAAMYGWDFPEVEQVPQKQYFSNEIDAIGHGYSNPLENDKNKTRKAWYYSLTMPPTFYLSRITYVVKCTDGNYAKFRPGTFYGKDGEKFFVIFRYSK